ncbi:sulfotransferase family protein [Rubrimonas cliftonensis]|uniref:Sulfotransferase family protein n=1 Tax=Rubrimonas cliftonensis TaxID=89524 RepID=A0A1H4CVI0_9RHOB|nr:sulfotransferase family protein [Rubrimonas cliftonensis]SEA64314.1 hypothetical protein SAMN05444370_10855 [Rubrimonas cliftonensis]
MKPTKVFCIGFQKTGTTSINMALTELGYSVASVFGRNLKLEELRATYVERGLAKARQHDAVEDMPWPLMFRELDAAFPGARFVLTWRETDRWLASICDHFGDNPDVMQQLTYGADAPAPVGCEARYAQVYDAHNAEVRSHFRDRPGDLLEMNLSHGDGWDALCGFIGETPLDTPFPRANSSSQRKSLGQRIRRRLRRMGIAVPALNATGGDG